MCSNTVKNCHEFHAIHLTLKPLHSTLYVFIFYSKESILCMFNKIQINFFFINVQFIHINKKKSQVRHNNVYLNKLHENGKFNIQISFRNYC